MEKKSFPLKKKKTCEEIVKPQGSHYAWDIT